MLFQQTQKAELQLLNECCKKLGVEAAISKVWEKVLMVESNLLKKLLNILETKEANYHPLYDLDLSIEEKD